MDVPRLSPEALLSQAQRQFANYLKAFPEEGPELIALADQLREDPTLLSRANMRGHITTSGLVYDRREDKVLMIHHAVLDRWLQPGGHHEGLDPFDVSAAREVTEETGVSALCRVDAVQGLDAPFDIESHAIPANPRKGEGAHVHHDFIYLFEADAQAPVDPQWEEVKGVKWVAREEFGRLEGRFARLDRKLEDLRLASGRDATPLEETP